MQLSSAREAKKRWRYSLVEGIDKSSAQAAGPERGKVKNLQC
jgi:hypothetical protein